jgi:transposase InsO family protein
VLAGGSQVTLSAGQTGQCWDNALSESFCLDQGRAARPAGLADRDLARRGDRRTRLHSTLGYGSPADFEEYNKIKRVA